MLHGDAVEVRRAVVRGLLKTRSVALAYRYAACGIGDQLVRTAGGVHVSPRGCGHRLCPRCGRKRGGRYARRILGWLAYEPHGDLWSIVLTQRVKPGEGVDTTRRRMAGKQRQFMRWCTRRGMTAGMTTVHIVWSQRKDGWHYHTHCLLEFPAGQMAATDLWQEWREISNGEPPADAGEAVRFVRAAGPPIESLREDAGDPEFWKESRDVSARAIQYPLRDMAQGIAAKRLGGDPARMELAARELVVKAAGWKLFNAWGKWQRACPAALAADEAARRGEAATAKDEGKEPAKVVGSPRESLGTVRSVWFAARRREQWAVDALREFERSVSNNSPFAKRFVRWCRLGWSPGG